MVVYIRSSRCVNLNMGLPRRLQQRNTCPQTSPGPQGSTFQLRTPPAQRPAPLNRDICVRATITLRQYTVEFLTIKTVPEPRVLVLTPAEVHPALLAFLQAVPRKKLNRRLDRQIDMMTETDFMRRSTSEETRAQAKCGLLHASGFIT